MSITFKQTSAGDSVISTVSVDHYHITVKRTDKALFIYKKDRMHAFIIDPNCRINKPYAYNFYPSGATHNNMCSFYFCFDPKYRIMEDSPVIIITGFNSDYDAQLWYETNILALFNNNNE